MAQTRVTVEGYGTFQIDREFVGELISMLNAKQAIALQQKNTVKEVSNNQFTGRQLIEEQHGSR